MVSMAGVATRDGRRAAAAPGGWILVWFAIMAWNGRLALGYVAACASLLLTRSGGPLSATVQVRNVRLRP
jgi:hypothetical protein